MKKTLTAFALVALTALTGCATDNSYSQQSHHKNWRERALEPKGGAHLQGTSDDVLSSGCCG